MSNRFSESRSESELLVLQEAARLITRSTDPRPAVQGMLRLLSELLGLNRGRVLLPNENSGTLAIQYSYGLSPVERERGNYSVGEGVTGRVRVVRAGPDVVADGSTAVVVSWAGRRRGVIRLADTVKPNSALAIAQLKEMGLTPVLLTGDSPAVAARVAAEVGIAPGDVFAGVLPSGKAEVVMALQSEGRRVAVVGDGVNDAVALAAADIGMAIGTGTDAAIEAGDITLVNGDLRAVPTALRLSARTMRIIKQNLFWAFGYNAAAIPLAAFGLLTPMIAGAAMAASSVLVVTNSLRLRRFH